MFKYDQYARRLNIFEGVGYGLTDVDFACDFKGECFIYGEGKYGKAHVPVGQLSFLESVVRSHWKAEHPAMFILFHHDSEGDVFVSGCTVTSVYTRTLLPGFEMNTKTRHQFPIKPILISETIKLFKELVC